MDALWQDVNMHNFRPQATPMESESAFQIGSPKIHVQTKMCTTLKFSGKTFKWSDWAYFISTGSLG